MNKLAKKWVKALESGKYRQTKGMLVCGSGNSASYCCLGVMCSIYAEETGKKFNRLRNVEGIELPKTEVLNAFGVTTLFADRLAGLNDSSEYTFEEIAEEIRNKLK